MSMNRWLDGRDHLDRRSGPAPTAAGDGQEGLYQATLLAAPAGGSVKVNIPALGLAFHRTAIISPGFTGSAGDRVLVAFDEQKIPWVLSPSGVTAPDVDTLGGDLSGSLGSAVVDTWGGQTKAQVVGSNAPEAHAASHASGGSDALTPANIGALAIASALSELTGSASTARANLGLGTAATVDLTSLLQASNNLSELTNRTTALGNLGIVIGTASFTYNSGTIQSNALTVTHNLGRIPTIVLGLPSGGYGSNSPSIFTTGKTSTTATFQQNVVTAPGAGTYGGVLWLVAG